MVGEWVSDSESNLAPLPTKTSPSWTAPFVPMWAI